MGKNRFQQTVNKWKNSPAIIWIFIVSTMMLAIAIAIFIEDYTTSLEGYKMFPTRKANDWIIPIVAFLPQVGQVGFLYAFASDTDKKWSIIVVLLLHVADVYSDVLYKTIDGAWVKAFIESELIFTLGSEIMLSTSFGMVLATMPDAVKQLGIFARRIDSAIGSGESGRNANKERGRPRHIDQRSRQQPQHGRRQQPHRSPQHPGERNFQMVGEDES